MSDKQQNDKQDELRDLNVPVREAETVKGGVIVIGPDNDLNLLKAGPPKPPGLSTRSGGEVVSGDAY